MLHRILTGTTTEDDYKLVLSLLAFVFMLGVGVGILIAVIK